MATDVVFSNVYMTYIENEPYKYSSIDLDIIKSKDNWDVKTVNTGWHVIPNFLWRHCVTPKQWAELVIQNEAYKVKSVEGIIYNPIPITSNLSLQRINTFSAFNNCTYAMTYTDDIYETNFFPWQLLDPKAQLQLSQREGMIWSGPQAADQQGRDWQCKRYKWPHYFWIRPNAKNNSDRTWSQGLQGSAAVYDNYTPIDNPGSYAGEDYEIAIPPGVFWDPYNRPESIGGLRAGKNSIKFSWKTASCDEHIWFNLDQLAEFAHWTSYGPYCGVGRPGTRVITNAMDPEASSTFGLAQLNTDSVGQERKYQDYTIPNMANMPLVQTNWFWQEIGKTIIDIDEPNVPPYGNERRYMWRMPDKYWPGPEYASAKYPPMQWFCKGIPLYDAQEQHIKTSTQVSFKITLTLECKKRRSALYAPTWGPFSGEQLYGHNNRRNIYQPACIRFRTGGARIPWQNIGKPIDDQAGTGGMTANVVNAQLHPRESPYTQVQQSNGQCYYNYKHRPAGIPDDPDAAARNYTDEGQSFEHAKRPAKKNIRVRFNRDNDETEILMDD